MYSLLSIGKPRALYIGFLLFLFSQVFSVSTFGQTSAKKKQLVGTWQYQNAILKIMDNNQLIFDGETSSYSLVPNAVRVYDEYGSYFDYVYSLSQGKLSITFPDGNQYVFSKVKPSAKQNSSNKSGTIPTNLYGKFCHYSGSSMGSSTQSIYFDGKGHFIHGNSMYSSGSSGTYYNENANTDPSESGTYSVSGNVIYLKAGDGSSYTMKITFIQDSGEITEVTYEQMTFAKSLCD